MPISLCKYHGGKGTPGLQKWILSHFPTNYQKLTYIEPFCGAASIFLNKKPSKTEIINDIDFEVYNLLNTVQDYFDKFLKIILEIEYTKENFILWKEKHTKNMVEFAAQTYILHNFSRGGLCKDFAWSDRIRRNMPGDLSGYLTKRDKLGIIHSRLQGVEMYNWDYKQILMEFAKSDSFTYIDSPYLQSTRTAKKVYKHEFTEQNHIEMLNLVNECEGKVMISGYQSDLYSRLIPHWQCYTKDVPNNSGQGKTKNRRIECLWTNWK